MKDCSVPISQSLIDNIEMSLWHEPISESSDKTHVTTLVARGLSSLSAERCIDKDLLEAF